MDWADDVAYSVHDVEDAVGRAGSTHAAARRRRRRRRARGRRPRLRAGTRADALGAALERVLATGAVPEVHDGSRAALAALKDMTSRLIGRFAVAVEVATRAAHGDAALARHGATLVVPPEARAECAVLKAVAAHYVMLAAERVAVYEMQREVVAELVDAYRTDPARLDADLRADHDAATDDAAALRVVVDQVASLTGRPRARAAPGVVPPRRPDAGTT